MILQDFCVIAGPQVVCPILGNSNFRSRINVAVRFLNF
jgi:hypothetical protein